MATRDLTYLIDFNVEGAEELSTAATNMETLSEATEGVNETATLDLELPDTQDIEEVGTAIGGLGADGGPIDSASDKAGGLSGAFGRVAGAIGLVEIASFGVDFVLGKLAEKQERIAATDAFNAAQVDAFAAAVRLAGDDVTNLVDALEGGQRIVGSTEFFGDVDITGDLAAANITAEQFFSTLSNGEEGYNQLRDAVEASGVSQGEQNRIMVVAESIQGNLSDAQLEAAASGRVFAESQASANEALQQLLNERDPMSQFTDEWDILRRGMRDGSIDTQTGADALNTLADGLNLTTEEVLKLAQADLDEAAEGARAFADALNSIDFQNTDFAGATSAFSAFTDELFAAGNEVQARERAFDSLAATVEDVAFTMNAGTEAGRAQQDALEGVARVIDTDLVQAYDDANGSQADFIAAATQIGNETLARLKDELNLTDEQVAHLAETLGLTEGDYEARFALAGAEEARLQLELLGGAIEGLPTEIEQTVTQQILAGDFVAARDTVAQYYADNPVSVPTEVDATGAEEGLAAVAEAPPTATIPAEADTIQAASDLLAAASEPRQALIVAVANNQGASAALETLANAERTATIDAVVGSVPSPSDFRNAIGTIRVPIVGVWSTRTEGSRPR